jgi:hypothetical protein
MPISRSIDKQVKVLPYNGILFSLKRSKDLTHCHNMADHKKHDKRNKADKSHILYDSYFRKQSELANKTKDKLVIVRAWGMG